jgi:DNA replication protein DnaC
MENMRTSSDETICPICNGAGFLRMDAPVGSPNFGRLLPCRCKLDEQRFNARRQLHQFGELHAFREKTFDTFDSRVRGTSEAFNAAVAFAQDPDGWLVLMGGYGCGKTHLAAAIANHALHDLNMAPIVAVVPDLLDYLRTTFGPDSETSYDDRFNAFRGADLLILDDLGTENTTPWAREKLFQIINHRYNEQLPMVVTTNLHDFDRMDPRVRSRLSDKHLALHFKIEADDFRERLPRTGRGRPR